MAISVELLSSIHQFMFQPPEFIASPIVLLLISATREITYSSVAGVLVVQVQADFMPGFDRLLPNFAAEI